MRDWFDEPFDFAEPDPGKEPWEEMLDLLRDKLGNSHKQAAPPWEEIRLTDLRRSTTWPG